mgnify:CR=1 FL=1
MRTGSATRPYFQFLTQDLEFEFEANKGNLSVVRALRAELRHRTRARALRLRDRIDAYLLRVASSCQIPARVSVASLPAPMPVVVAKPKVVAVAPAPVFWPAPTPVPAPATPDQQTWTWGYRLGIAAVVLALLGFMLLLVRLLIYSATLNVVLYENRCGTREVTLEVPATPGVVDETADRSGQTDPLDKDHPAAQPA